MELLSHEIDFNLIFVFIFYWHRYFSVSLTSSFTERLSSDKSIERGSGAIMRAQYCLFTIRLGHLCSKKWSASINAVTVTLSRLNFFSK